MVVGRGMCVYMSLRDIDPEDRVTMQNHGETV